MFTKEKMFRLGEEWEVLELIQFAAFYSFAAFYLWRVSDLANLLFSLFFSLGSCEGTWFKKRCIFLIYTKKRIGWNWSEILESKIFFFLGGGNQFFNDWGLLLTYSPFLPMWWFFREVFIPVWIPVIWWSCYFSVPYWILTKGENKCVLQISVTAIV